MSCISWKELGHRVCEVKGKDRKQAITMTGKENRTLEPVGSCRSLLTCLKKKKNLRSSTITA